MIFCLVKLLFMHLTPLHDNKYDKQICLSCFFSYNIRKKMNYIASYSSVTTQFFPFSFALYNASSARINKSVSESFLLASHVATPDDRVTRGFVFSATFFLILPAN